MASIELWRVNSFRDRHGKMRHYFRPPGHKPVPLPGLPGSDEFMEAYRTALRECKAVRPSIGESRTPAGTLDAAIVAYYASPDFKSGLAAVTQSNRRAILERWRIEDGAKRFSGIRSHHLTNMLAPKKPNVQKNWLKAIRGLMKFGKKMNLRSDDPTQDVEVVRVGKSMGHMTWLEPQVTRYREHHKVGTMPRLALELLLNVAGRRQDAHVLGRQHINRDGKLSWRPQKTRRSTGKTLTISIMPELQVALDAMPKSDVMTFLLTEYGRPFASAAAFGNKFADWCTDAGLRSVVCDDGRVRNYRAHGLRKAALRALAHAGCTGSEMMNVSGHSSLQQLQEYLDEVEQERQADAALTKLRAAKAKT
ncbi:tyrosine-type recombinase/integrase [Bradyrhizobium sp. UFLA05-112]